jgi:HK97 gp10 family phage protein
MAIRRNGVTVSWKGLDRLERKFMDLPDRVEEGTLEGLEALGLMVQNSAREKVLKGPKTGRLYKKSGSVAHRASAPGEAPASDTGTLVRSIVSEVQRVALEVIISAGTAYAKMLEYGTRKMSARPFMLPALDTVRNIASRVLTQYIRSKLK